MIKKVSIVIPVYNGSNYLKEAIESALHQTYKNIEIIVVNDGSDDNRETRDIALRYKDKIKYIEKVNGGVASALNVGIKEMQGEYFSWLSHDDIYYPNKIEEQIKELKKQNEDCLIWSNFDLIDKNSNILITFNPENFKSFENDLEYIIYTRVHGCSLLIPKSAFKKAGYFDETLKTTQDNDMWSRILQQGHSLYHINKSLVQSRQHECQTSVLLKDVHNKEKQKFYKWIYEIIKNNPIYDKKVFEFIKGNVDK